MRLFRKSVALWTGPPTSKLGTLLLWSLALSMPIYNNFQINEASGETYRSLFCFKIKGSGIPLVVYFNLSLLFRKKIAYFKVKLANVVNFQIDFTIVAYFKTSF